MVALVVCAALLGLLATFGAGPAYAQQFSEFQVTSKESGIESDCEKAKPDVEACTFEDAVHDANANSDASVITFALESVDRGQIQVVDPGSALNGGTTETGGGVIYLPYQTRIDGFSQIVPDLPAGTPPIVIPKADIVLYGRGADRSTIRGLMLPGVVPREGNYSAVISLGGTEGARIEGNWLGIGKTPDTANGAPASVSCTGCSNAVIGGPNPEDRNVLSGNRYYGVWLDGASDVTVSRNYIGLAPDGKAAGNRSAGIYIIDSYGVTVGGAASGDGNVISGNGPANPPTFGEPVGHGVSIYDSSNIRLQQNRIGTNDAGSTAIPNTGYGVEVRSQSTRPTDIAVGTPGSGNLISGNGSITPGSGVGVLVAMGNNHVSGFSTAKIQGNRIGTTADGTGSIPNRSDGVGTYIHTSQVTVGGSAPLAGNVIANSQSGFGVQVRGRAVSEVLPDAAEILGNSIYNNAKLGISLGGRTYPLPNDETTSPYDTDFGENEQQNYPVLDRAASDGSQTTVNGKLRTTSGTFRVEVFSSPSCDPSGNGEGRTFLGAFEVVSDGSGEIEFAKTLPTPVPEGDTAVTATATNAVGTPGKTSEFSKCIKPRVLGEPPVIQLVDSPVAAEEGDTWLYGYTLDDTDGPPATVTPDCGGGGELRPSESGDPSDTFWCYFPDGDTTTTVSITADDGHNIDGTDTDSADVTVSNVTPAVTDAGTQEATTGQEAYLDLGSFTDPGLDSEWEVAVDWGDGSEDTNFTASSAGSLGQQPHTYATSGVKTVTITVAEAGGSPSGSATFQVDVNDPPPQLHVYDGQQAYEGREKSFYLGDFEDPGTGAPYTVAVDWGDGSTAETFEGEPYYDSHPWYYLNEQTHTYVSSDSEPSTPDDDPYTVTVTVTEGDEDPSSDSATFQITANEDPPPQLYAPSYLQQSYEGKEQLFYLGYFEDPGSGSPWEVSVDWGDGTTVETFTGEEAYAEFYPYYELEAQAHTYADSGTYNVTVTVTEGDEDPSSDTGTFEVTAEAVGERPDAVDDGSISSPAVTADEDTATGQIDVLSNDSGLGDRPLSVSVKTQGSKGTATVHANNAITYTPKPNANGSDSFIYEVCDADSTPDCDTATVWVAIDPRPDPPLALNDSATTRSNTAVTIKVLANDSDADGDRLAVSRVPAKSSKGGKVTTNGTTVGYKPKKGFRGRDRFSYTISDGHGGSATATVNVTVTR